MLKDRLLQSGFKVLGLRLLGVALVFILTWLMTHYYGASGYGNYIMFSLLVQIFSLIVLFGMDQYGLKTIASNEAPKGYINLSFLIALVGTLILIPLIFLVNGTLQLINQDLLLYLFPAIFFLASIRISAEVLRSKSQNVWHAILSNVSISLLFIISLAYLLFQGLEKGYSLAVVYTFSLGLVGILGFIILVKHINSRSFSIPKNIFTILKKSSPFLLVGSLMFLNEWVDKICLKLFTDSAQVGIYSLANRLTQFIAFPLMAFNVGLASTVSQKFSAGKTAELQKAISLINRNSLMIGVAVFLVLIVLAKYLLQFFGQEFIIGQYALYLLALAQLVNVLMGPVGVVMKMTNGASNFQYIILASVGINILLNVSLIPIYGINGAAFATLLGMIVLNVWAYFWIKKNIGVSTLAKLGKYG